MTRPRFAEQLLLEALATMRRDPAQDLKPLKRLALYEALGPEVDLSSPTVQQRGRFEHLTGGYRRYVQLAIVTAGYALPIWEQDMSRAVADDPTFPQAFPHRLLAHAEAALQGTADLHEVDAMMEEAYFVLGALPYSVTYDVICVFEATYAALSAARGGLPFRLPSGPLNPAITDVALDAHSHNWDVAWLTAQAVSAIDHDPIGADERTQITYDAARRRAFWERWLTEAIPSVWKLEL